MLVATYGFNVSNVSKDSDVLDSLKICDGLNKFDDLDLLEVLMYLNYTIVSTYVAILRLSAV